MSQPPAPDLRVCPSDRHQDTSADSTGDGTDADPDAPDRFSVEQVRRALRAHSQGPTVPPLGMLFRRRLRRLITPALAAGEELLAATDRIGRGEDAAAVLAHYDTVTAFLVDLGDEAAQLRIDLGLEWSGPSPHPDPPDIAAS